MSACLVSASENLHHLHELLDALASNLESLFSLLDCSETRPKFKIYYELGRVYMAELPRGSCALVQLLQLNIIVLGLPSPLLR